MDRRIRFETLYRAQGGAVRAFVHRRVPPAAADDVVADVFVIAWRRLDDAPAEEFAWLLRIARGVLANRRRVEARRVALRDRLAANATVERAETADRLDDDSVVMRALQTLSERDQELLLLVAWDGLDRPQAAHALGISPSTFSVRLHRARRRLARAAERNRKLEERQAGDPSAVEAL
jgi:RNA polymerase sigma factor (sigma-70 family)